MSSLFRVQIILPKIVPYKKWVDIFVILKTSYGVPFELSLTTAFRSLYNLYQTFGRESDLDHSRPKDPLIN